MLVVNDSKSSQAVFIQNIHVFIWDVRVHKTVTTGAHDLDVMVVLRTDFH